MDFESPPLTMEVAQRIILVGFIRPTVATFMEAYLIPFIKDSAILEKKVEALINIA